MTNPLLGWGALLILTKEAYRLDMKDSNNVNYTRVREELRLAFEQLEKGNLTEEECNELKQRVFKGLDVLSYLIYEHPRQPFFTNLYRVRKAKALEPDEDISEVTTFYYPTPDKCSTARANIDGCPVFYVSDNSSTAIKEANCKDGETIFLSEWSLKGDQPISLCILLTDGLDDRHYWKHIEKEFKQKLQEKMSHFSTEEREELQKLHRLCSRMFAADNYQVSSLIGHYLLYEQKEKPVDALLYPSQADARQYCNLAVATHFADEHLRLVSLKKVKVAIKGEECKAELIEEAEVKNGDIRWESKQKKSA